MCIRDRYGAEPFEQQQFETAGVEVVKDGDLEQQAQLSQR